MRKRASGTPVLDESEARDVAMDTHGSGRACIETGLQVDERMYRGLVEMASDIPYVTDTQGILVFVGPQVGKYGYEIQDLQGCNLVGLIYPEDMGSVIRDFQRAVELGIESVTTFRIQTPAMGLRYFEDNGTTLRDEQGLVIGTSGLLRDITQRKEAEEALQEARDRLERNVEKRTAELAIANEQLKQEVAERKRTEEALRESEERFRNIYAESPIGIELYDADGGFLGMNQACADIFGIPDIRQARPLGLFDTPSLPDEAKEMLRRGKTLRWEGPVDFDSARETGSYETTKSGTAYIDVAITPLHVEGKGSLTGYLIQIQDITERKRSEEALRQSEEQYRLLAENITDVIYCTDMNGQPTYVSPSVTRLLGYSLEEAMSRSMEEGLTPASRETVMTDLATEMAHDYKEDKTGSRARRRELEFYRKDGSTVWAEVTVSFRRDSEGQPVAIQGIMRDITERRQAQLAMQKSEEQYRLLAENVADVIWTMDMELRLTYVSPSVTSQRGYTVEEAMCQSFEDILVPPSLETAKRVLSEGLKAESQKPGDPQRSWTVELEMMCKDGSTIWTETSATFLRNSDGAPVGYMGVSRDISERKRSQEALRQSESRYRSLFDNVIDAVLGIDGETLRIVFANQAAAEIHGSASPDEVVGLHSLDLIHPDDRERIATAIAKEGFEKNLRRLNECRALTKDGGVIWVEAVGAKTEYEGRPTLLASMRDITERKLAEEALRESEQRYRLLAENITDVIYCTDMNGRATYMSPSVTRLLGYSVEEATERSMEEGLTPTSRNTAMKDLATEMALDYKEDKSGSRARRREFEFYRKDGSTVWAEVTVSFQRDSNGQPIAIQGIMRDISERKRDEEELRRTLAKLERSNAELERFAYVASHHLQEPLRQVTSYVQLLAQHMQGKLDSEANDFMDYAVEGAHRMHRLINDFLSYARLGMHSKTPAPTDCEAVLYRALGSLRTAISESEALVTHDTLPTVMADEEQLVQLFQHLVDNAVKFRNEEQPRIQISAERRESEWLFSVSDNGIGIAPEFFDRIFLVFHRLHSPVKYPGTGIGLAVCRKVIEHHEGNIWVQSQPGKGSTFYFTIPMRGEEQS